MSQETAEQFSQQLDNLIQYFALEFNLSVAEAVGCLEAAKHGILERSIYDATAEEDGE